jgi:hypothetical protein
MTSIAVFRLVSRGAPGLACDEGVALGPITLVARYDAHYRVRPRRELRRDLLLAYPDASTDWRERRIEGCKGSLTRSRAATRLALGSSPSSSVFPSSPRRAAIWRPKRTGAGPRRGCFGKPHEARRCSTRDRVLGSFLPSRATTSVLAGQLRVAVLVWKPGPARRPMLVR